MEIISTFRPPLPPVTGATVAIGEFRATTGADGRFAIGSLPFADGVEVIATRNGYATATATVNVRPGNVTTIALTMASTSTVGTITGRVLDQAAQPLPGAAVTVQDGDQTLATTTSGADGAFTAENVPIGEGYTLRVTAEGFAAKASTAPRIEAATVSDAGAVLLVRARLCGRP